MNITTQAIVLRHTDYRENDRMLTLLTPELGRVDALARGCKKPGSPLLAGAELFAFGEYVLFRGRGRATVVSCSIIDSFYDLRTDYERLRYAAYMLQVIGAQALPAERPGNLFTLLLRSFKRVCYTQLDARAVTAAFLLMDAALSGYRPRLRHCVRCGRRLDGEAVIQAGRQPSLKSEARLFDIEEGGLVCRDCERADLPAFPVSAREITWLRDVLAVGIERTACPPQDAPLPLLMRYMESRLETRLPGGRGLR